MSIQTVDLKRGLPVENGGHILYAFNDKLAYIDNIFSYAYDGLKLGHVVLLIDYPEVTDEVKSRLRFHATEEELQFLFFEDTEDFYQIHKNFECETIFRHFEEVVETLPIAGRSFRSWARVVWGDQQDIMEKLEAYEVYTDHKLQDLGIIAVCAYDASVMPADQLIASLKTHDYFMTDVELVRSPLYAKPKQRGVFPSLSVQSKIESEIDFYKRNLDFVHVVSHEVRNPLTIVNAYANIVRKTEKDISQEGRDKLSAIEQYVKVIDNELTHIIDTEQMLSNELYMKLEVINPSYIIHEVSQLMEIKSAVQNVQFVADVCLADNPCIMGNQMGLRLILSNLISNAIKYTAEQGKVTFSARVDDYRIRFVIEDDGIGMSESQLNSLFQKYGKLDESRSGQGIGLYIVKNLTDRFSGRIQFNSELGQGTQVTVEFPLVRRR